MKARANALGVDDLPLAQRNSHTCKGLAATVSAVELAIEAKRLDSALRAGDTAAALELLEPISLMQSWLFDAIELVLPVTTAQVSDAIDADIDRAQAFAA